MALLTKKKSGTENLDIADGGDLFGEMETAPRADLDLREKNIRRGKLIKWGLIVSLAMIPVSCLGSVNASNLAASNQAEVAELKANGIADMGKVEDDPGKFAATSALQSWLDAVPAPLPGGQIMSWDGSVKQPGYDKTKVSRMLENFTVLDGAGRGYTATLEVSVDPRGGAQVMFGPSLIPIPQAATDGWAGTELWPGLEPGGDVTPSVSTAVQSWATAYTSGDADALRVAVGDGDSSHTYLALSGITSVTASASAMATTKDGTIARVELQPTWAGRSNSSSGQVTPMIFDVLIQRADTAAPQVVAWGAPGSGPRLKPYVNAITVPANVLGTATAPSAETSEPTKKGDPGGTANTSAPTGTGSPSASGSGASTPAAPSSTSDASSSN